jgi:Outer membrane protein beta-barrel domain
MRRSGSVVGIIALALGVTGSLAAQGEFGIKAGASFGNISNKGVLPGNLKTRTGAAGGLYLGSGGVIGFGIEGLYAQRGAKSDESFADSQTRLDYIDVPVYLKLQVPTPGIRPYGYAGPQISFEVRCKTAAGAACPDNSERKKTDYAAVIGGGVRIGSSRLGFRVEGRYVYGLADLKVSTVTSSESYKTRTFLILVGIGR